MSKIMELIEEFRLNQQIQDRTPEYELLMMMKFSESLVTYQR